MHPSLPAHGLYAITDGPRADLFDAAAAALRGGAVVLQYRDKTQDAPRRLAEALRLRALCTAARATFIVNDDVALAHAVGADGVHLGEGDEAIAAARARLGAEAIIGSSCYDSLARARQLAAAGADYLAFGAFHASPTKPVARRADPGLLAAAKPLGLPLVAIGGITRDNARALIDAGADFVAVISGVFARTDIESAARDYAILFHKNLTSPPS